MPFSRVLGIRVVRLHPDGVTIACAVRDELRNFAGMLHGGVTATLADAAVGIALARHFKGARPGATAEMNISYLRPIVDGQAVARARLLRVGEHLCVGRVDIQNARRQLAATAMVTYLLLETSQPMDG